MLGPSSFDSGDLLGEGNYSMVYRATLKSTQELYALKVVDKSKVKRYKKQDEVIVEKWVLSHLGHPSMIRLFHTFQDQGSLYLALEHVPGGELFDYIVKEPEIKVLVLIVKRHCTFLYF